MLITLLEIYLKKQYTKSYVERGYRTSAMVFLKPSENVKVQQEIDKLVNDTLA